METSSILMLLCLVNIAKSLILPSTSKPALDRYWETFKTIYDKRYNSQSELVRRLIWESNLEYIQRHNLEFDLGNHSYSLGMNEFGDLTHDEFKSIYLSRNIDLDIETSSMFMTPLNVDAFPLSKDWRTEGYVSSVKHQGTCGSCYTFASIGALEGQYYRGRGVLLDFSEQQVVDCSSDYDNHGCDGGTLNGAFNYLKDSGVESESDYPYSGKEGECDYSIDRVVTTISGYVNVRRYNETMLLEAVAKVGPISVSIDGSSRGFQFYKDGVFDDPWCSKFYLNHAALVVGYGYERGKSHWIVKNSWGTSWGQEGYILMSRNNGNQCGIASRASYPSL
jgi:cathepsin L